MKPKIPKSVKKPLPASARPKTSPSSKPEKKHLVQVQNQNPKRLWIMWSENLPHEG
jgi:hypothetical protein